MAGSPVCPEWRTQQSPGPPGGRVRGPGLPHRGLSGLRVSSLERSLQACAPGAAVAQPEGAAASAGSQTPSCCLWGCVFPPRGKWGSGLRKEAGRFHKHWPVSSRARAVDTRPRPAMCGLWALHTHGTTEMDFANLL